MKLVLMPGLDGTGLLFEPLLSILPPSFSPVVISYPPIKAFSYTRLLTYLQEKLAATEDYVLLAESFSGPLAVELAATGPARLKALVLCATFVFNPTPLPRPLSFLVRSVAFNFEPPKFFVERYLIGEHAPARLNELLHQALSSVPPSVLASRVRAALNVDARAALQACQAPILYLAGRRDKLVARRGLAVIQEIRRDVEFVEIDGPHFLLQSEPEECLKAIARFVNRVLGSIHDSEFNGGGTIL